MHNAAVRMPRAGIGTGAREAAEGVVESVSELHHAEVLASRAVPPHRRPARPRGSGPRHHEAHGRASGHGEVRSCHGRSRFVFLFFRLC